jgi:hypothetical protein
VTLESEGGTQSFALSHASSGDPIAARGFAELTANALLEIREKEADRAALALSQRFGLVNRVASLLILETDAEYTLHELKSEHLDLEGLARAAAARASRRPSGAPDTSALSKEALDFVETLRPIEGKPWRTTIQRRPEETFPRPTWPERLDPVAVYREAAKRFQAGEREEPVRVLSSIVEESPRDARALRLTGFTLMGFGRYEAARSLFARTRSLRSFEPQAFLCEALAHEALGRSADAALLYELVLARSDFDPRYAGHAKESAKRLYGRLLAHLAGNLPAARGRAAALGLPKPATHELHLFWNLDDTDVDLHVREGAEEVSYQRKQSSTGGTLFFDNTAGLGPEIYVHETRAPDLAYVRYFGTRSVEGTVPSATLLVRFASEGEVFAHAAVLTGQNATETLFSR